MRVAALRASTTALRALVLALAACESRSASSPPPPPPPPPPVVALDAPAAGRAGLIAHLEAVIALDLAPRRAAIAGWQLPADRWAAIVVPLYRDHQRAYADGFAARAAGLAAALDAGGAVAVRGHYADDPALAPALRRARLAFPVGRPGTIARIDGRDLPAVFVHDRGAWYALAGIDDLTRAAIAGFDPACAAAYATAAAPGHCMDASAPVAALALTGAGDELAIACRRLIALAATGCTVDRGSVAAPSP